MVPKALPFQLRLHQNDLITSHSGKSCGKGERFFACSQAGKQRILTGKRWVWGRRVSIVATRTPDGELLIVATNHRPDGTGGPPMALGH
ncbi:MAG: hypothetical protein AAF704_08355 [Cyanobacteria bacterium P01_D01_bin.123]